MKLKTAIKYSALLGSHDYMLRGAHLVSYSVVMRHQGTCTTCVIHPLLLDADSTAPLQSWSDRQSKHFPTSEAPKRKSPGIHSPPRARNTLIRGS